MKLWTVDIISNKTFYTHSPSQCGLSQKLQEFLQVMCSLLELKSFRTLKELFLPYRKHAYIFWNVFDWPQMFFCEKVRTLSPEQAANCSTDNSAFWFAKIYPMKRIFPNENMEAPCIIWSTSTHHWRGVLYSLTLG